MEVGQQNGDQNLTVFQPTSRHFKFQFGAFDAADAFNIRNRPLLQLALRNRIHRTCGEKIDPAIGPLLHRYRYRHPGAKRTVRYRGAGGHVVFGIFENILQLHHSGRRFGRDDFRHRLAIRRPAAEKFLSGDPRVGVHVDLDSVFAGFFEKIPRRLLRLRMAEFLIASKAQGYAVVGTFRQAFVRKTVERRHSIREIASGEPPKTVFRQNIDRQPAKRFSVICGIEPA